MSLLFNNLNLSWKWLLLVVCLSIGWNNEIYAQSNPFSNQRSRILPFQVADYELDSLTILSESVRIFLANPDSSQAEIQLDSGYFSIQNMRLFILKINKELQAKYPLLWIQYRVLPFNLGKTYTHFDSLKFNIEDQSGILDFSYNPFQKEETDLDFGKLDYNGSFSRGLSFGNSQDVVLNSNFNLQLSGDLGDDIEVLAAITDENIPLQPEGNTQQLQEFDKIFIQLKKGNNKLIAGDYELLRPKSYFMNYYKKLQGATFSNSSDFVKGKLNTQSSIAVARGQFSRNIITAIEGNQGPYKLNGAEGERFIITLAGTEKVFLDGELLTRGIDEDYIIDYNRAEVRFTNKRLITKDVRIIIEFEYSDQQYLTSLYAVNTNYESKKWQLSFNVFSQQDGRTPVDSISLSQQMALNEAGDNPTRAVVSSIDSLSSFDPLRVLYEYRDTVVMIRGVPSNFRILAYSKNPNARLTARFSQVGIGNGNYILSNNQIAASGRIFEWIAPDPMSGSSRGNYEPVIQLATPKQQQLYSLNAAHQLSKNASIRSELSLSNNDLNRFSSVGDDDNLGLASYTNYQHLFNLGKKGWQMTTNLSYEWVQEHFQALNPYRNAEFRRDWNVQGQERRMEQIGKGGFRLQKQELGSLEYEFSGFWRDSIYEGRKHLVELEIAKGGWEIDGQSSLLNSNSLEDNSRFFRPKLRIKKTFEKLNNWQLQWYGEREKNNRFNLETDTLSAQSFYYDLYRTRLQSPQSEKFNTGLQYSQRFDYQPFENQFKQIAVAEEVNWNGDWRGGRVSRLNWNLTYRNLEVVKARSNLEPQETYLGRVQHQLNAWKGTLRSSTTYEIGSGQEPKIEYNYLKVQKGEGTYVWMDYNQDSIAQINEFEIANFQDVADYVRVSIFTDDFIRSNQVQYNQSLTIDPKRLWQKEKGIKKVLSQFSTQSSWRINRKVLDLEQVSAWNPFQLRIADTALVATSSLIRNVLFFNRNNPKFNLQIGAQNNQQKQVITSGFESRKQLECFVQSRWNMGRQLSAQVKLTTTERSNDSERFQNRDYQIQQLSLEPQLTWLPSQQFRSILIYKYLDSDNELGIEQFNSHDINLEATYNRNTTTAIRLNTSYVLADFQGDANTPVAFTMLNGLKDGKNFFWTLSLDRQLGKNLRLSLSYEGRKTGSNRVVHLGRMQIGAVF